MAQEMTKAANTMAGMAQFERLHSPVKIEEDDENFGYPTGTIICNTCEEDWPCERMGVMLISQALAMLQQMLPTGNMASILSRFSSSQH